MKNKVLFLLLLFVYYNGKSQDKGTITPPSVRISEQTPKAPNTASLGKYIDFPVNMATGIPQISIPLFEIKQGNITLPVSISYHAGGVKVNESSSWVGMGWSLSYGVGTLTKKVNGLDDFSAVHAANNSNIQQIYLNPDFSNDNFNGYTVTDIIDSTTTSGTWNTNHILDLRRFYIRITQGAQDGEADEYYFSTPEGGGKFYYNQKTRKFEFDNNQNWKVIYNNVYDGNYNFYDNGAGPWKIISNKGVVYEYNKADLYENPLVEKPSGETGVTPSQQDLSDSWVLTKITDVQNNKQINFSYTTYWRISRNGLYMSADYRKDNGSYYYSSSFADEAKRKGFESVINRIDFDEGYVLFVQDINSRQDGGINALKEIQLYNNKNILVKKYILSYFYDIADVNTCSYPTVFNANWPYPNNAICDTLSKRLFLQSLQEVLYDKNATVINLPAYQFNYNFSKKLPSRMSFAQDFWGGANGKVTNTTMLASIPDNIRLIGYPGIPAMADRSVDTAFLKAGIIKEIIYPTGGKAVFEFEGNTTTSQQQVGGLRIKRISNKDTLFQQQLVTEFDYNDNNGNSTGETVSSPVNYYNYYQFMDNGVDEEHVKIESDPLANLYPLQNSPVLYRQVTKKIKGQNSDLISKHYFIGYNVNSFYDFQPETYTNHVGVPKSKQVSLDKYAGLEYKTEMFRKNNLGQYELIQKNETTYSPLTPFNKYIWNIQAAWTDPHFFGTFASPWKDNDPFTHNPPNMGSTINAYKIYKNDLVVRERNQYTIEGQTQLNTKTYYNYDKVFGNIKNTRSINSVGDTLIQVVKYVSDYQAYPNSTNSWNIAINSMLDENITSLPIEILQFIKPKNSSDSLLTKSSLFEYENFRIKRIYSIENTAPISNFQISSNSAGTFVFDTRYSTRVEIISKDNFGNPLSVKDNNVITGHIWDTKNSIPIATVLNASNQNIAYSNFEIQDKGNWVYNGNPIVGSTLNGVYEYNLSSGIITSQNTLDNTREYIVTFWVKTGTGNCLVNGLAGTTLANRNGYTLNEVKLPIGTTTVNITGNGTIDELRMHPKDAQMVTSTYEPLVGVTSLSDINNRISYYEYDGLGRLGIAKDQDKNIVKKNEYKFQVCPLFISNSFQSRNYRKNNCGIGNVGSIVAYSIPAGKYTSCNNQAELDQMVESDFSSNGQAFANSNGACTPCSGTYGAQSGWTSFYSSITPNSNVVSITIVVAATSPSSFNNINSGVIVGTINSSCCWPSVMRSFTCMESGRVWNVSIYPNGQVLLVRSGGAALPSPYQGFTLTGSFNL